MRTSSRHASPGRQRGAVAIIFGLTLALLIGFAGLAIDLGRFFVIKSELQNAMDACALSASTQLRPGEGATDALVKARAYGRVFTTGGVALGSFPGDLPEIKNMANFQSEVVNIEDVHITFSDSLGPSGSYGAGDPNTARFVRCEYPLENIPVFFMLVLNMLPDIAIPDSVRISAMAAATLAPSSTVCAIPVAVCRKGGEFEKDGWGLTKGEWLIEPDGPGSSYGTGNFRWVVFEGSSPPDMKKMLEGSGQCALDVDQQVSEPSAGEKASLTDSWRSRFGVYKSGDGKDIPQIETASPDWTGFAYNATTWPGLETSLVKNAYAGINGSISNYIAASTAYEPYQVPLVPPNKAYKPSSVDEHKVYGRNNRRLAVAPVIDCEQFETGGANPKIDDWACVLMLDPLDQTLEFLGVSTKGTTPCATNGEPGTFGPLVPQLVQ